MKRKIGKNSCYVAVISHNRPNNVNKILNLIGPATFFVNKGEKKSYLDQGALVVECGDDICSARNKATEHADGLPCVQVSDDLRKIKIASLVGGKTRLSDILFSDAVDIMLCEMLRKKIKYGGVAVTNNPLNYNGTNFSYDKLIVNDLICTRGVMFDKTVALKEDYDMVIQQLIYTGAVLRCNHILCDFPHRENKGGANDYRNSKTELEATFKLKAKWGPHIKDHPTRPGQVALNYRVIEASRKAMLGNVK